MHDSLSEQGSSPLHSLNPEQLIAATHFQGPILVLAGAGSGKTRALTHRIANLIEQHGVSPQQILAVTFTNKAANEMRSRLFKLLGNGCERLWVSTFHSVGLRILRRFADRLGFNRDFIVYDDQDSRSLLKAIVKELGIDEKRFGIAMYQRAIDTAKNSALDVEQFAAQNSKFDHGMRCKVYEEYQKRLRQANAMDFGDLLLTTVQLFEKHPDVLQHFQYGIRFILVDEYQDTNHVQYLLLRQLGAVHRNVLVVGDDDQSIYAFRGANIRNILEFEQDFPNAKVVKLEQNYRSTTPILECAHATISKNKGRMPKKLWTNRTAGDQVQLVSVEDETKEAEFIAKRIEEFASLGNALDKVAIFYRTNAQSRALEEALIKHSLKYKIFGGLKFFERKEVKDTIAYLRLLLNPLDGQAFLRVVNVPTRGVGAQTLQLVIDCAARERSSLLEASQKLVDEAHGKLKGIVEFVNLIDALKRDLETLELPELIGQVIEKSGYVARLQAQDDPTHQSRIENLKELQGLARSIVTQPATNQETTNQESMNQGAMNQGSMDQQLGLVDVVENNSNESRMRRQQLAAFLDRATLTAGSDVSEEKGERSRFEGSVSLMTLHLAKGLEFPLVFLVGLEEGLLPHSRSLEDAAALEEERRLFYVGITRAMDHLVILHAEKRAMFDSAGGAGYFRLSSRFLRDLPDQFLSKMDLALMSHGTWNSGLSESNDEVRTPFMKGNRPNLHIVHADNLGSNNFSSGESKSISALFKNVATKNQIVRLAPSSKPLSIKDLSIGFKVQHTVFGAGVVEHVSDIEDEDARAVVRFDKFSEPKKLVLKHTKLYAQ